jgi:hypothetical protein
MNIRLDRTALDDVGANPKRLAEAIHDQMGDSSGPVLVRDIALALDIDEIREESLTHIEAALITTPERGYGAILVNSKSSSQRRRFSIGHELGHFLSPWHQPTSGNGFQCSRSDMIATDQRTTDRHLRQEAEANSFAIELLAPRKRVRPYLSHAADLRHVLGMATDLDISREAAARRYVELHHANLAVVFGKNGCFSYATRGDAFPALCVRKGQPIECVGDASKAQLSDTEEVDASEWLYRSGPHELSAQTLHQQNGFSITLLCAAGSADDPDDGIDDAYERFTRPIGQPRR